MIPRRAVVFCLALWILGAQAAMAAGTGEEGFAFGRFGRVHLYRETPHPSRVVLFASGDGGWNLGVVDMARALARLDALVVGFDVTHYLRELGRSEERCSYCAADFEALSQYVQRRLDFPAYRPPVLVGYSSGATLVYATLVQAPPGTFLGAISLGFCPDLPLRKPLCRGNGLQWEPGPKGKGVSFLPAANLEAPWIALQGTIDQVCDPAATKAFVKRVAGGRVVLLPKVGHGFSVQRNWLPQFRDAFGRLTEPAEAKPTAAADVAGLPLVEVPAEGTARNVLVVLLSGDGGWAGIDRQVAGELSRNGVGVVGLDSLQYFWTARTPESTAADLDRILRHYLAAWGLSKAALVGYSLGADVLPATVNRLAPDLRRRLALVGLIGPSRTVRFEFHLSDWLGGDGGRPILPEAERLPPLRVLCVYGSEESGSLCPELPPGTAKVVAFKGSHHLGGDYRGVADEILKEIR